MKTTLKAIFIAITLLSFFSCEDYFEHGGGTTPEPVTPNYASLIANTYSGTTSIISTPYTQTTEAIAYLSDFTVARISNDKVSISCRNLEIVDNDFSLNCTSTITLNQQERAYKTTGTTTWHGYPVEISGIFRTSMECGTPPLPPFDTNAKTNLTQLTITIRMPEGDMVVNFSGQVRTNKVLMLMVDYTTNQFEGGKELYFDNPDTNTFTVTPDYNSPGDFGSIEMRYSELNKKLFFGTIIWMGRGEIKYPQNLLQANDFTRTVTADYYAPGSGFENVFNTANTVFDYVPVWRSVQNIVLVRNYLQSNPDQTVKIFLYTPSVGVGNPADWKWILFVKN